MSIVDICQKGVKDFLPTASINQGTMFPILPSYCSCGLRIGCYQRYIESAIGEELERLSSEDLTLYEKQSKARIATFKKMGITRDCCLLSLTEYPFLTVNDIEGQDAYVNTTIHKDGSQIKENDYLPYSIPTVGVEFFSKSSKTIGFDMDLYGEKLQVLSLQNSGKPPVSTLAAKNAAGEASFPKFPNMGATRIKYPSISTTVDPPYFKDEAL